MGVDLARETALKVLYDINEKGAYSNISINRHLDMGGLKDVDKAFITEMVYGTIKWKLKLDYIISQFSRIKLKKLSPWIKNILRLGLYQVIYMDRVPDSAVCNESVKLAKRYGHSASGGFVNGVLRNIIRKKDEIKYPNKKKQLLDYLSVIYSHPAWMVDRLIDVYGHNFTEDLLKSNNEVAPYTVRVNTLKISRDELIQELKKEGIKSYYGKYLDEALIVENPTSTREMETFKKGYFQVQDESSMLVAKILDPEPGELIIDVCSAPGGKATHIAQLMNNKGTVIARDIHEHKVKLIDDTVNKLGTEIVKTQVFDALKVDETLVGKCDGVLVDAPCTGLGIIRRKPDIKWTRNTDDEKEIARLQLAILKSSSQYVKPGGVLVYSTCTVLPEENEEVIKKFMNTVNGFEMDELEIPAETDLKSHYKRGCIRLYPHEHGVDGFFIARMKRSG